MGGFHLAEISKADVSMWACVAELASRVAHGGGPNDCIALGLYVVFVIAFTALDMFVLVIAAFQQHTRLWEEAADSEHRFSALGVSHALKKLSMMDVALVGIFIVLLWIRVREGGVVLAFPLGLVRLVLRRGVPLLDLLPCHSRGTAAIQASGSEEDRGVRRQLLPGRRRRQH